MSERDVEIVIRAKDEFTGPVERMEKAAIASAARIRDGFSKVSLSPGRSDAGRGEGVFSGARRSAAKDATQVNSAKGEDARPDDENFSARLSAYRDFHRLVHEERRKSNSAISEAERAQAVYEISLEKIKWDLKVAYAQQAAGILSNTLQNLFVLTGSKNRSMFEAMKAFAIAETIIQTYRAAMGSYAALAPIPVVGPALGAAAAAAAIIAGLARVEQIRNTKPGGATSTISHTGHANPGYSGGSSSAYPVPQRIEGAESKPVQNITIQIYNPLSEQNWQKIVDDNIIPALKDAGDRNISVSVRNMGRG